MTNDLLETIEKLFRLHVEDGIHPSKRSFLKNCSMFYCETENNVLQSENVSVSHGTVAHQNLFTKMLHASFTLVTRRHRRSYF